MSVRAVADLLEEEMAERGWTSSDVAVRILRERYTLEVLALDMLFACRDEPNMIISDESCEDFARVFGVSTEFFRNLRDAPPIVEPRGGH